MYLPYSFHRDGKITRLPKELHYKQTYDKSEYVWNMGCCGGGVVTNLSNSVKASGMTFILGDVSLPIFDYPRPFVIDKIKTSNGTVSVLRACGQTHEEHIKLVVNSETDSEGKFVPVSSADLLSMPFGGRRQLQYHIQPGYTYFATFGVYQKDIISFIETHPELKILYKSVPTWNNHYSHRHYDFEPGLIGFIFEMNE